MVPHEPTPRPPLIRQVTVMFEPTRLAPIYLIQAYALLRPGAPRGASPAPPTDEATPPALAPQELGPVAPGAA